MNGHLESATPHSARREMHRLLAHDAQRTGASRLAGLPVHVYLQVASACNLDCFMCSEHLRPPEARHGVGLKSLAPEVFEQLEREVFPSASELTFGVGGEPTIADRFLEYVERAYATGLRLHLVTNGTRLNRERFATTISKCFETVMISVDAAERETYEAIRKGARWKSMLRGLELFQEANSGLPEEERCRATLAMVLMRRNVAQLPEFIRLAHRYGIPRVSAQHVHPATPEGATEQLFEAPALFNDVLPASIELARELGVELDVPGPFAAQPSSPPVDESAAETSAVDTSFSETGPSGTGMADVSAPVGAPKAGAGSAAGSAAPTGAVQRKIPCVLPTVSVNVLVDGRIAPCCHPYAHRKMALGQLGEASFREIWNGFLARELRRSLVEGDAPTACQTCTVVLGSSPEGEEIDELTSAPTIDEHFAHRRPRAEADPGHAAASELSPIASLESVLEDVLVDREALRAARDDWAYRASFPGLLRRLARCLPGAR